MRKMKNVLANTRSKCNYSCLALLHSVHIVASYINGKYMNSTLRLFLDLARYADYEWKDFLRDFICLDVGAT